MQPGREEDDRNALRRVAVVIASVVELFGIARIVDLVVERQRLRQRCVGRAADVVQLGADAIGADQVHRVRLARLVVAVPADHVDVQLRDDRVERHRRVVGEVPRAVQPALLAGVPDEQQRPLRPRPFANARASAINATVPEPSSSAPFQMRSSSAPGGHAPGRAGRPLVAGVATPRPRSRRGRSARRTRRRCSSAADRCLRRSPTTFCVSWVRTIS